MSNNLNEFATGVRHIQIDKYDIPIKPIKKDKWKLLEILKNGRTSEEKYLEFNEVLKKIIKQGFVEIGDTTTDEELDNFLIYHEDEVYLSILAELGLINKDKLNELKESKKKAETDKGGLPDGNAVPDEQNESGGS